MKIKKLVKPKKVKLSTLRNKCDKTLQEAGRKVYEGCLVCGRPISCLHHFYPKSMSNTLRYDWENMIPLCQSCHFSHHNGNPDIHAYVIKIKGEQWHCSLKAKKTKITKISKGYYLQVLEQLSTIIA